MQYSSNSGSPKVLGPASAGFLAMLVAAACGQEEDSADASAAAVAPLEDSLVAGSEPDSVPDPVTNSVPSLVGGDVTDVVSDTVHTANAATASLGTFEMTYYWMAKQGKAKTKRDVQLYTKTCKPQAKVGAAFAKRLLREGTGVLRDGRIINVSGDCNCKRSPCYFVLNRSERWGVGVGKRALSPFRSVAVDPATVPIGTILYLPELDGLTMPGSAPYGGFVHDGCVIADDRGGAVDGQQLDFFMAKKSHWYAFHRRHRISEVTVYDGRGRCAHDGKKLVPVNRNAS